ncbi:MAG: metallophosphoesterase [Tannerella sp.]|jgi:predicted MPP superfamily phosphohydrolase|nr:metallophosphoesterase [Tannerella sp.]
MRVFLQAIFGQVLLSGYLLWRGQQALPRGKKWRLPFVSLFVLEWILYFSGYFFHDLLPDSLMIPILLICNTWYIASMYLVMGMLLPELILLTGRRWKRYPEIVRRHWQGIKRTFALLLVAGVTVLMISAYRQVACPVVTHVNLHIPKAVEGRDSLTVALMCDMHFGEFVGKKQARHYVSLCNAQHPDLIVLAGDLIDYESLIVEQLHIEDDLRQLTAPLGVYLILGNHEYRANRHAKLRWMKKTGGVLLVDSVAMPDSAFYLVGRDDAVNPKRAALHTLMKGLDLSKPVIVLDHQPVSFNEIMMNRADLGLHGHTHNGQLWPYRLLLKFVYECVYGYYRKGDAQFYVSSGIGCAGAPYRTGTRSELVVLHITFEQTEQGK